MLETRRVVPMPWWPRGAPSLRFHRFVDGVRPVPEETKLAVRKGAVGSWSACWGRWRNLAYRSSRASGDPPLPNSLGLVWRLSMLHGSWRPPLPKTCWELAHSPHNSQLKAMSQKRILVEIPALVQPLAASQQFARRREVQVILEEAMAWRWSQYAHHSEGSKVALRSLKRTCRVAKLHGKVKLTLTDNLSCLIVCCWKREGIELQA